MANKPTKYILVRAADATPLTPDEAERVRQDFKKFIDDPEEYLFVPPPGSDVEILHERFECQDCEDEEQCEDGEEWKR